MQVASWQLVEEAAQEPGSGEADGAAIERVVV